MSTPRHDWLDEALPSEKGPMQIRHDAQRKAIKRTTKREELAALLNQLTWEQRIWLRALAENEFNSMKARRALRAGKLPVPASYKISRWAAGNPAFVPAREAIATLMYESAMPSKAGLLLRINEIAEYSGDEVEVRDDEGRPTGERVMRDPAAALKANEMLGKAMKVFGDEKSSAPEGPQLIVQIISQEDHSRVIDVTPGKVQIAPQRIEPDGDVIDAEPADGET